MSHGGGGGSEKRQKSVTYFLNGPLRVPRKLWEGTLIENLNLLVKTCPSPWVVSRTPKDTRTSGFEPLIKIVCVRGVWCILIRTNMNCKSVQIIIFFKLFSGNTNPPKLNRCSCKRKSRKMYNNNNNNNQHNKSNNLRRDELCLHCDNNNNNNNNSNESCQIRVEDDDEFAKRDNFFFVRIHSFSNFQVTEMWSVSVSVLSTKLRDSFYPPPWKVNFTNTLAQRTNTPTCSIWRKRWCSVLKHSESQLYLCK